MTIEDPHSAEDLLHYEPVKPPVRLVGDPDDPLTSEDVASLDGQEAQDAQYDREHAADAMLEVFLAGLRASSGLSAFGTSDPAFALGEQVGWFMLGQIALKPELAPLWDALVK